MSNLNLKRLNLKVKLNLIVNYYNLRIHLKKIRLNRRKILYI